MLPHFSDQDFKTIVELAPDPIIIVDHKGVIQFINAQAERYFGYAHHELIGQFIEILVPQSIKKKHIQLRENYTVHPVMRPMGVSHTLHAKHKNGHALDVDISLSPFKMVSGEPMILSVIRDISAHRRLQEKLNNLAQHDPLTSLLNTRGFLDKLLYTIHLAQRKNWLLAVCYIDLDHFKPINDTYGHKMGDLLLDMAAHRIRDQLRREDVVARIGGDEFVCLLVDLMHHDAVNPIVTKLKKTLSDPFEINNQCLSLSVSIGISMFPQDGEDENKLLSKADTAMYRAKKSGGNCSCFY